MARLSVIVLVLAFLKLAAAQYAPCAKASGSYHLSCYTKDITAQEATAAKEDCFQSWNQAACNATVEATFESMFGCDTAIIYSFVNQSCRASYQGQEKTNAGCSVYKTNSLGNSTYRQNATVMADYGCPNRPPCNKTAGAYHLSCYAKDITAQKATAAKEDCFKSWNKAGCNATVEATFMNTFGCDTAISYSFVNQSCLASYQAQEKTNPGCSVYKTNGLGNSTFRQEATVLPDYSCPLSGPCDGKMGAYHLSCYAKDITGQVATAAKEDCFQSWNETACNATVVATYSGMYGCDTAIAYKFANESCRASYQGQEKTNAGCNVYKTNGLGNSTFRQEATVMPDYSCPLEGPCKNNGSYHISCYAKSVNASAALAAKNNCFEAWNEPACNATVRFQFDNMFNCDTFIAYSFRNESCRASYQAQEKTNTMCTLYDQYGLGDAANRMSTTLASDYSCSSAPAPLMRKLKRKSLF